MTRLVPLGEIVVPAPVERSGDTELPVLSMTRASGLVPQEQVFRKRVASRDLASYKVVRSGQLVVGIHIDEGAIGMSGPNVLGVVSPAYTIWDLRRKVAVDPSYLDRFLRSPRAISYFIGHYRRTADRRGKLTREQFLALEVPLPPIEEQSRIAGVLDAADALRAKRRQALATLDTLSQAIFIDMFGSPGVNPNGFPVAPMIDLVDPERPITYGILKPGEDFPGGVRYVRVVDMVDGSIDPAGLRRTTPDISARYRRSILRSGDLLLSIRGHVGRLAIVQSEVSGANITQDTARLAITGAEPTYVLECLRSVEIQRWMAVFTKGAAVRGINLTDVKKIPIPLPPPAEQERLARLVARIASKSAAHRTSQTRLETLFVSLQQRAFRGEL
jgi:type I restriction enzyme S subunit